MVDAGSAAVKDIDVNSMRDFSAAPPGLSVCTGVVHASRIRGGCRAMHQASPPTYPMQSAFRLCRPGLLQSVVLLGYAVAACRSSEAKPQGLT